MGPASCGPYLSWGFRRIIYIPAERAGWRRRVGLDAPMGSARSGWRPRRNDTERQRPLSAVLDSPKGDYRTEPSLGPRGGRPLGGSRPRGHDKSELGTAAGRAAHADGAAVRLDQALDDVQAETGAAAVLAPAATAAGLAAPELAEHPGGHVRRDALTLVAHGNGGRV